MRTIGIDLVLEQDAVFTAASLTLGAHETLDHIRGAVLRGAAAAAAYTDLEHAGLDYDAFHAGRVRFLDAVPLIDGEPTWPIPFGWLHPKGTALHGGGCIRPEHVYVAAHLDESEAGDLGLVESRSGYVTRDGRHLDLERGYRLKTAIDRERRGRPDTGRLFGYESLAAGSRWRALIEVDDEVDPAIDTALRGVFDGGLLWLGRSRGAEYGRTRTSVVDDGASTAPADGDAGTSQRVAVLLRSDLALRDLHTGEATLHAGPEAFGLPPSWRLVPTRSNVRTRRYAPYNAKRRARDPERPVLERRSVLVFEGDDTCDVARARATVARGVGAHRAEGMGQVEVAPWLLADRRPAFEEPPSKIETDKKSPLRLAPPGPLGEWMASRLVARRVQSEQYTVASEAADRLLGRLDRLKRRGMPVPSRSQWNRLAGLAELRSGETCASLQARIESELFATGKEDTGVGANAWRGEDGGKPLHAHVLPDALGKSDWPDALRVGCLRETARLVAKRKSRHRKEAAR